ncbi:MAG: hypothetical protein G01um10143_209 [Parcubacteria group bacterium Gr01-1014_3]|nr:MAG: hypothetical protein G01um10143_209 [Parcubacteria group bacterium Gr01-1014_3]
MDEHDGDLLKSFHNAIDQGDFHRAKRAANSLCNFMLDFDDPRYEPMRSRLQEAIDRHDIKQAHKIADELVSMKVEENNAVAKRIKPPAEEKEISKLLIAWYIFIFSILVSSLTIFIILTLMPVFESKTDSKEAENIATQNISPESICSTDEQRELIKKYPPENCWLIFERRENHDDYGVVTESGYFIYPIGKDSNTKVESPARLEKNPSNAAFMKKYQDAFCRAYTIHDWRTGQIPSLRYYKMIYFFPQASDYAVVGTGYNERGMRILCDQEAAAQIKFHCGGSWSSDEKIIKNTSPDKIRIELGRVHLMEIGGWVIRVPSYSGNLGLFIPRASDHHRERRWSRTDETYNTGDTSFYVDLDRKPVGYYSLKQGDEPVLDRDLAKKLTGYAVLQKFCEEQFVVIYASRADYDYRNDDRRVVIWPRYRLAKELEAFADKAFGSFELPLKLPERKEY